MLCPRQGVCSCHVDDPAGWFYEQLQARVDQHGKDVGEWTVGLRIAAIGSIALGALRQFGRQQSWQGGVFGPGG